MNESLVLTKMLNTIPKSDNLLQSILLKLQELKFFNEFIEKFLKGSQKDSLLNLCGRFKMEHHKGGSVLFKERDPSNDKLYIIFRGSVALLRAKKFDTFLQPPPQPIETFESLKKKVSVTLKLQENKQKDNNNNNNGKINFIKSFTNSKRFANKLLNTLTQYATKEHLMISQLEMTSLNDKYGETVRILTQGDGFGEVAIIEGKQRGLSACVVSQDCFLLILKKEDFDIVKQYFIKSIKEKKSLIYRKFEVKDAYSTALMNSFAYSFDVETFQHNQILTVDGMSQKVFYLISSGEIQLEKMINNKNVKICILTRGQFVGEEVVINQDSICEYTSKVISIQATLMVMNKSEFFQKFPEECKKQILQEYKSKKLFRKQFSETTLTKIAEIQSPKSQKAQTIDINVSPHTIRSSGSNHFFHQDINLILEEKKAIYRHKYSSSVTKNDNITLFQEMCYTPKMGTLPSYSKLQNVLQSSFKQKELKSIVRKKAKYQSSLDLQCTIIPKQIEFAFKNIIIPSYGSSELQDQ